MAKILALLRLTDLTSMQVKLAVIKSLKPMLSLLLPNDDLREQVYDYIPLLLAEFQGSLEALFITQVRARLKTFDPQESTAYQQA